MNIMKITKMTIVATFAVAMLSLPAWGQDQTQNQDQTQGQDLSQNQDQGQAQDQGQGGQFQGQGGGQFQGQGGFQGRGGGRRNRLLQQQDGTNQMGGGFQRGFRQNQQYGGYGGFAQRQTTGDGFTDQYGNIYDHNIFMKDRGPKPVRNPVTLTPLTPEQSYVLTGAVQENGEFHAYAENVAQGGSIKLKVGDAIARGKVAEITIGQIAYEHDGEKTWVVVGANLTGNQVDASTAAITSRVGDTGQFTGNNSGNLNAGGGFNGGFNNNGLGGGRRGGRGFGGVTVPVVPAPPLPGGDAANLSIEERMRLRRQAEGMPQAAIPPGLAASLAPTPAPAAPADQPKAADAPIIPGASNLSVEEQMRLRRAQQIGN